jgi:hypothetical protein
MTFFVNSNLVQVVDGLLRVGLNQPNKRCETTDGEKQIILKKNSSKSLFSKTPSIFL